MHELLLALNESDLVSAESLLTTNKCKPDDLARMLDEKDEKLKVINSEGRAFLSAYVGHSEFLTTSLSQSLPDFFSSARPQQPSRRGQVIIRVWYPNIEQGSPGHVSLEIPESRDYVSFYPSDAPKHGSSEVPGRWKSFTEDVTPTHPPQETIHLFFFDAAIQAMHWKIRRMRSSVSRYRLLIQEHTPTKAEAGLLKRLSSRVIDRFTLGSFPVEEKNTDYVTNCSGAVYTVLCEALNACSLFDPAALAAWRGFLVKLKQMKQNEMPWYHQPVINSLKCYAERGLPDPLNIGQFAKRISVYQLTEWEELYHQSDPFAWIIVMLKAQSLRFRVFFQTRESRNFIFSERQGGQQVQDQDQVQDNRQLDDYFLIKCVDTYALDDALARIPRPTTASLLLYNLIASYGLHSVPLLLEFLTQRDSLDPSQNQWLACLSKELKGRNYPDFSLQGLFSDGQVLLTRINYTEFVRLRQLKGLTYHVVPFCVGAYAGLIYTYLLVLFLKNECVRAESKGFVTDLFLNFGAAVLATLRCSVLFFFVEPADLLRLIHFDRLDFITFMQYLPILLDIAVAYLYYGIWILFKQELNNSVYFILFLGVFLVAKSIVYPVLSVLKNQKSYSFCIFVLNLFIFVLNLFLYPVSYCWRFIENGMLLLKSGREMIMPMLFVPFLFSFAQSPAIVLLTVSSLIFVNYCREPNFSPYIFWEAKNSWHQSDGEQKELAARLLFSSGSSRFFTKDNTWIKYMKEKGFLFSDLHCTEHARLFRVNP